MIVSNIHHNLNRNLWTPEAFDNDFGQYKISSIRIWLSILSIFWTIAVMTGTGKDRILKCWCYYPWKLINQTYYFFLYCQVTNWMMLWIVSMELSWRRCPFDTFGGDSKSSKNALSAKNQSHCSNLRWVCCLIKVWMRLINNILVLVRIFNTVLI